MALWVLRLPVAQSAVLVDTRSTLATMRACVATASKNWSLTEAGMMGIGAGCRVAIVMLFMVGGVVRTARSDDAKPKTTTVFVVRHAEKATTPRSDPPLTEAGRARAALLVKVLRSANVTAVYTSGFARTDQTAAPIAEAANVKATGYDARHSRKLAAAIERDHAGGVVLVVGHSNTIPSLLDALGVTHGELPVIADDEYDNLFIVTITGEQVSMVRLRFGASWEKPE